MTFACLFALFSLNQEMQNHVNMFERCVIRPICSDGKILDPRLNQSISLYSYNTHALFSQDYIRSAIKVHVLLGSLRS